MLGPPSMIMMAALRADSHMLEARCSPLIAKLMLSSTMARNEPKYWKLYVNGVRVWPSLSMTNLVSIDFIL